MKTQRSLIKLPLLVFFGTALLALFPIYTRANTIALDFTGHNGTFAPGGFTEGWSFTVNSAVLVTDLGVWDGSRFGPPGNGLAQSIQVTIWDKTTMTALAFHTVPSGTTGTLVNDFRYVSLNTPVPLGPGSYVIGAYYRSSDTVGDYDIVAEMASGITTAPELTFGRSRQGGGNAFPAVEFGDPNGNFGPNFQFTDLPNGVPDAGSSWMLLGIGLVGIFATQLLLQRHRVFQN